MAGGAFNTQVHPLIRFAAAAATCLASSSIKRRLHPHCNPYPPPMHPREAEGIWFHSAARVLVGGCSPHFEWHKSHCSAPISCKNMSMVTYFAIFLKQLNLRFHLPKLEFNILKLSNLTLFG
jgi:hypothetical protein